MDQALLADAKRLGASAGSAYRMYLEAGLAQLKRGAKLPAAVDRQGVLRTVYVRHAADEQLQAKGFRLRIEPMELSRRVTRLGMLALQALCDDGRIPLTLSKTGGPTAQRAGVPVGGYHDER